MWVAYVRQKDPGHATELGFGVVPPSSSEGAQGGRPKTLTPEGERHVAERIERRQLEIDRRMVAYDRTDGRTYGDDCRSADALRSLLCDEHRRRLIRTGVKAAAAERRVEKYRRTPEFEKRFRSHQVRLSRAMKR